MEKEIKQVKRQLKWLQLYAIISSCILLIVFGVSFSSDQTTDLIRTRGIIIEDSTGRDRILIGSPIPASPDRVRTNLEKVKELWSSKSSDEKYLEKYPTFNHNASGIVFLNEKGIDKLIVGDKTPDPNLGRRIGNISGIIYNTDEGFERGGIGILKTNDGKERVLWGMDDETSEALHLFVLEDGTRGLNIGYEDGRIIMGRAKANNPFFGNKEDFAGIMIQNKAGKVLWQTNPSRSTNSNKKQ